MEVKPNGPRHDLLRVYVNDHLAGATAGARLADRVAQAQRRSPMGRELDLIATQIHEDRAALIAVMQRLGFTPNRGYVWLGRVGERVGRLKPNGRVVRRSPLSTLIELEALRMGVLGKAQAWAALALVAEHDPRLERDELLALQRKAEHQADVLETLRLTAANVLTMKPA
jgi:hypothetical protein